MWSRRAFEEDIHKLENILNTDNHTHHITAVIQYRKDKVTFYYQDRKTQQRDHYLTASIVIDNMTMNNINAYHDDLLPPNIN